MPVVPAFGARTCRHPLPCFLVSDVAAVMGLAGFQIDRFENVLKHGLLVRKKLAGRPVELPQDARFTNREDELLSRVINEDARKDFSERERFARSRLKVLLQVAVIRM